MLHQSPVTNRDLCTYEPSGYTQCLHSCTPGAKLPDVHKHRDRGSQGLCAEINTVSTPEH